MYHWLDKVIAEQAAHYGVTPERLAQIMGDAADVQEQLEEQQVDKPEELND